MPNDSNLPVDDQPSGELFEPPEITSPKLSDALRRHAAHYYKKFFRGKLEEKDEGQLKEAVQRHRDGEVDFKKKPHEGEESQQGKGEKGKE